MIWKLAHEFAEKAWKKSDCGCHVDETSCPPRVAGEIFWKFARGALPEASIVVRNVSKVARTFQFSATPLAGVSPGDAALSVLPASATLSAGECVVVRVELKQTPELAPAQDYRAEILIRGAWEQAVSVLCHVTRDMYVEQQVEQSDHLGDRLLHPKLSKAAIAWHVQRGVDAEAVIEVQNKGAGQPFDFEATPLVGPGTATVQVAVDPDVSQIPEGGRSLVRLKLTDTTQLKASQTYHCEIVVRGHYEQRLPLTCHVEADPSAYVRVEQGDAPTRLRAHRYTDHFQCTDNCGP
jgi:hypothetical protein